MNVVLIGYRACGKSTVGKLLAEKLNFIFLDTDSLIEDKAAISIKEIIANHGWDYFRAREKEVVQKLALKNKCVIATGGGVVLDEDNVNLLKKIGLIIWLNTPLADIIKRLSEDAEKDGVRPQFTNYNLAEETAMVLKERIPLYQKAADFVLDTSEKGIEQVMEEIFYYLRKSGISATGE
ncbi:MAG: shikimate kinase [Smithella sp.]